MTPAIPESQAWVDIGTRFFIDRLERADIAAPSLLPGWSVGHVAAHVSRNAEAVGRLLDWARTGVETPMYPSPEARTDDIERDAGRPFDVQLDDVRITAAALDRTLASMDDAAWTSQVRSARGRLISAGEVPWLRVKEVWLHAVDIGAPLSDLPPDLVDALLADVAASLAARDEVPGMQLTATDSGRGVDIGDGAVAVAGPAAELLGWLTGRRGGDRLRCADPLPTLPAWL